MTSNLPCNHRYLQGSITDLAIFVWDQTDPDNDISAATATIAVYGERGEVLLATAAAAVSGITLLEVSRLFDTSNAMGKCRAVATVTLGTRVSIFQWSFMVDPNPAPQ